MIKTISREKRAHANNAARSDLRLDRFTAFIYSFTV
jgi:hypothetical protein